MEEFDQDWFVDLFRVSLPQMKLYARWDKKCPRPFCVIGYDTKSMSFKKFKSKILALKVR